MSIIYFKTPSQKGKNDVMWKRVKTLLDKGSWGFIIPFALLFALI